MTFLDAVPNKVTDILRGAKSLYVSACAAEIADARDLLRHHAPRNAVVTGIFSPIANRRAYSDPESGLRVRTVFLNRELKQHMALGLVEYCPWRYAIVDDWLSQPGRFDTALVMLSPPDANGRCSLGLQTDFLPRFLDKVERVIGFVNPRMPATTGSITVDYRSLSAIVDYDAPLVTIRNREPDAASTKIAEYVASLVKDGATVQFGLGQIPSRVIALLKDHKDLSVHTGIVDDNIIALEQSGALRTEKPIVTGTAIGGIGLYEHLMKSDRYEFRPVSHTHAYSALSRIESFTAINSVLQIDLFGQVSAESSGGKLVASPGGLPDFARGALASPGGQSIVAVRAKGLTGHSNGVVPLLDWPHLATMPGCDADIFVTENGVAQVRNLTLDARAEAIIAIADPNDQAALVEAWARLRAGVF